jgi:hypothetical protein
VTASLDAQAVWTERVVVGMLEVLQDGEGFEDADLARMSLDELARWVEAEMRGCDGAYAWSEAPPRSIRPLLVPRVAARIRETARSRQRAWRREDPDGYEAHMDRREEEAMRDMDPRESVRLDAIEASHPEDWYADF